MRPDLALLQPYPFQKLNDLKAGIKPPSSLPHINLSIGEPQDPAPDFVREVLAAELGKLGNYPTTQGIVELRQCISAWLGRRFHLPTPPDPERQVLPVNGTREALFAFAQLIIDRSRLPVVVMPNPFYQIYEGAALLAGAEPAYVNCTTATLNPDFDSVPPSTWARCQLLYICSPGNPTGAVLDLPALKKLIELADRHDFVIASDECYSEIYNPDASPPPGLLQACAELGRDDFRRCVVFHSLSKRSNLPGLRSGFVAGDGDILERFLLYRTYHGCSMPIPHQLASIAAWNDEQHVAANRRHYQDRFRIVSNILAPRAAVELPDAGFYLWLKTPIADDAFARDLFARQHVTVVPGRYLARDTAAGNPGINRVRIALVAPAEQCRTAAERIKALLETGCG